MHNETEFYPEIVARYKKMLEGFYWCEDDKLAFEKVPFEMRPTHLLWMLETIQNEEQSLTKKHRWLGYIQAALILLELTTVDAEREYTRKIFNGD